MKEENQSFLLFFLFLEKERKRMGEGGRLGPTYIPIRPHKGTAGVIGSILPS